MQNTKQNGIFEIIIIESDPNRWEAENPFLDDCERALNLLFLCCFQKSGEIAQELHTSMSQSEMKKIIWIKAFNLKRNDDEWEIVDRFIYSESSFELHSQIFGLLMVYALNETGKKKGICSFFVVSFSIV